LARGRVGRSHEMNKTRIKTAILEQLRNEFEVRHRVSKQTRSEGNNSESKAEGKYDTLSIEQNYLADGLARQAHAAVLSAAEIETLPLIDFATDDAINIGALVRVEFSGFAPEWFFLCPSAGGTEVLVDEVAITVLTPESPLGSQLMEKRVGDRTANPSARILAVQ